MIILSRPARKPVVPRPVTAAVSAARLDGPRPPHQSARKTAAR
ncbi:hypothetical protein [Streptomyces olivochromogenes]|nr:hypothetical protein [Streptomyces olivochromogenes]